LTDIHLLGLNPGEDVLMDKRQQRPRRAFTPEFRSEVVELCRKGDRSIGAVARDLDLTETSVRNWVRQAEIDAGEREGLTTAERQELARLRKENRVLREERDVLKRATAFFAKETR
jgi:transposase